MNIKKLNGLNILIDKKLELMMAIQAVYLKKHQENKDKLNYIETPKVGYLNELEKLFSLQNYQHLIEAILSFDDESACVEIALSLNDDYELEKNRANLEKISMYIGNVNLNDFVKNFKTFAMKVKWDDFFISHQDYYLQLYSGFCAFPENLDLSDLEKFYAHKSNSYNYISSILINGGFAYSDKLGNLYYIRGIEWSEEKKNFYYDKEYLLECLFHEFSHPMINCLVDKYFSLFTSIDTFYEDALKHNLPASYQNKKILLYEYFVRANANILTRKYYHKAHISKWILNHGFPYLNALIDYTIQKKPLYPSYEELFKNELIQFINKLIENNL